MAGDLGVSDTDGGLEFVRKGNGRMTGDDDWQLVRLQTYGLPKRLDASLSRHRGSLVILRSDSA